MGILTVTADAQNVLTFSSSPAGGTNSFLHTCSGQYRLLVLCIQAQNTPNLSVAPTYGGYALTLAGRTWGPGSTEAPHSLIYYKVNPPTGSHYVVVTWAVNTYGVILARSYTNVDQAAPVGTLGAHNGTGYNTSITVAGEAQGKVIDVGGWVRNTGGGTKTMGTGQTALWNAAVPRTDEARYVSGFVSEEAGAASVVMSQSFSVSEDFSHVALPIMPYNFIVPSVSIARNYVSRDEGNSGATPFTFTVTRSGDTSQTASCSYAVSSAAATGADFVGGVLPSGTVSFAAGQASATITINVQGDYSWEADESFTVTLSSPVNCTISTATATSTILNDDTNGNRFRIIN